MLSIFSEARRVTVIARPLVCGGCAGDLAADGAHLVPDAVLRQDRSGITATLGRPAHVRRQAVRPSHVSSGVTLTPRRRSDLRTYLGAFGHAHR